MAVNGNHSSAVMQLDVPPGKPDSPFVLPFLGGENIFIPCSNSATRLLVTGKETNNAFAVVGSGGTAAPPIGFHFHRETHDVFLCLKGNVNIWAGEKCRTMAPGDFASVPPVSTQIPPLLLAQGQARSPTPSLLTPLPITEHHPPVSVRRRLH
jgi:mannose-6-phosphate isomerase-like protein (cupin superfamily)